MCREMEDFKKLMKLLDVKIDPNSIVYLDKPDIRCKTNNEVISFELTEVANRTLKAHKHKKSKPKEIIENILIQKGRLDEFKVKHRGRIISIHDSSPKKKTLSKILDRLLLEPIPEIIDDGGYNIIENDLVVNISNHIKEVEEPVYTTLTITASNFDACIDSIKNKFSNKKYDTTYPIELIVYFGNTFPVPPLNLKWFTEMKNYVEKELENSLFKRVWIIDLNKNKLLYKYPQ